MVTCGSVSRRNAAWFSCEVLRGIGMSSSGKVSRHGNTF